MVCCQEVQLLLNKYQFFFLIQSQMLVKAQRGCWDVERVEKLIVLQYSLEITFSYSKCIESLTVLQ